MNKKTWIICIVGAILIAGCKKIEVDFSYSPAAPRAGEIVKFTNNSSAGEEWAWNFGDNAISVVKNPSHTFKKPGNYIVTLMVDSAKHKTCSHSITIYDTIPTFIASTDSICHLQDVILTANIYNPYNYSLSFQWELPDGCVLVRGSLTGSSIVVYFTTPQTQKTVGITIQQGEEKYHVTNTYDIHETKAPAVVMRTPTSTYRQRLINERRDSVLLSQLEEDVLLLSATSDTCVMFNDVNFCASKMGDIFPTQQVKRLQIDAMAQKWYITTAEGLFVANFNGQNLALIDAEASGALYVDATRNLLYWATPSGLNAMALIKSKNNQFATTPILYNELSDIDRIVVNNNHR